MRRLLLAAALAATPSLAAEDAVPSCYKAIPTGLVPAAPAREVFVLIDQTTPLPPEIKTAVDDSVRRLVKPGTRFTIASFSAFSQGRATTVLSSGTVETGIPPQQRGDVSVPLLRKIDQCLAQQESYANRSALGTVGKAIAGASSDLAKSDVLASLSQLSARVAASKSRDKIVIIVSDMIENSGVTTFYAKRTLRRIDPQVELDKVGKAGVVGNFGGARVYVIGGALLPDNGYRAEPELKALEKFWDAWLRGSKAKLVEFGRPNLVNPVE